ncbi:MAG: tyrosine-protein phosphatase [Sporolactobacillus sp.]
METGLATRALPLQGAYNFRDMGGLRTKDGRTIKKGLLYRSADLTDLTDEDRDRLRELTIRLIFDYRDKAEADMRPDPQIAAERHERIAVNGEDKSTARAEWNPGDFYKTFSLDMFAKVYSQMPIQNQSYRKLMGYLSQPERNLPILHHCAGGRDRTGVGAMLILRTLDVPFETVMEDYLLSNQFLEKYHQEMFAEASHYLSDKRLQQFQSDFLVQDVYLESAAGSIKKHYGSFDSYLASEFGIDDTARQKIMDFCLE